MYFISHSTWYLEPGYPKLAKTQIPVPPLPPPPSLLLRFWWALYLSSLAPQRMNSSHRSLIPTASLMEPPSSITLHQIWVLPLHPWCIKSSIFQWVSYLTITSIEFVSLWLAKPLSNAATRHSPNPTLLTFASDLLSSDEREVTLLTPTWSMPIIDSRD